MAVFCLIFMTLCLIASVLCAVQSVVVGVGGSLGGILGYALAAIFFFGCFLLAYGMMKLKEKYERTEKELRELKEKVDARQDETPPSSDDSSS